MITMFPYNKEESNTGNAETEPTQPQIRRILRTVSPEKAFHFYEGMGKPTGEDARSLIEFRDKINVVTLQSLVFHLRRKDFENWFTVVIGDPELAEQIRKISPDNFDIQVKLYVTVSKRVRELKSILLTSTAAPKDTQIIPQFSKARIPDIKRDI